MRGTLAVPRDDFAAGRGGFQLIENELVHEDEHPELLGDYTGCLLRKCIPRAFPGFRVWLS